MMDEDNRTRHLPNVVLDHETIIIFLKALIRAYAGRQPVVLGWREMRFPILRYITFLDFPHRGLPDIRDIVDAGFYYAGTGDTVFCYCCGFSRGNWVATDIPFDIHRRYSPCCEFFRNIHVFNIHAFLDNPDVRATRRRNIRNVHGPTLVPSDDEFENDSPQRIFREMRGVNIFTSNEQIQTHSFLPTANLPGEEEGIPRQESDIGSSFANELCVEMRPNTFNITRQMNFVNASTESQFQEYMRFDDLLRVRNTDSEQENATKLSENIEEIRAPCINENTAVRNETDESETARKTFHVTENEQTNRKQHTVTSSSRWRHKCFGISVQPAEYISSENPYPSLMYRNESATLSSISSKVVEISEDDMMQRSWSSLSESQSVSELEEYRSSETRSSMDNHQSESSCFTSVQNRTEYPVCAKEDSLESKKRTDDEDMNAEENGKSLHMINNVHEEVEITHQQSGQSAYSSVTTVHGCMDSHDDENEMNENSVGATDIDLKIKFCEHTEGKDLATPSINKSPVNKSGIYDIPLSSQPSTKKVNEWRNPTGQATNCSITNGCMDWHGDMECYGDEDEKTDNLGGNTDNDSAGCNIKCCEETETSMRNSIRSEAQEQQKQIGEIDTVGKGEVTLVDNETANVTKLDDIQSRSSGTDIASVGTNIIRKSLDGRVDTSEQSLRTDKGREYRGTEYKVVTEGKEATPTISVNTGNKSGTYNVPHLSQPSAKEVSNRSYPTGQKLKIDEADTSGKENEVLFLFTSVTSDLGDLLTCPSETDTVSARPNINNVRDDQPENGEQTFQTDRGNRMDMDKCVNETSKLTKQEDGSTHSAKTNVIKADDNFNRASLEDKAKDMEKKNTELEIVAARTNITANTVDDRVENGKPTFQTDRGENIVSVASKSQGMNTTQADDLPPLQQNSTAWTTSQNNTDLECEPQKTTEHKITVETEKNEKFHGASLNVQIRPVDGVDTNAAVKQSEGDACSGHQEDIKVTTGKAESSSPVMEETAEPDRNKGNVVTSTVNPHSEEIPDRKTVTVESDSTVGVDSHKETDLNFEDDDVFANRIAAGLKSIKDPEQKIKLKQTLLKMVYDKQWGTNT